MKTTYTHLLFDLDGTLTDPMEGITRSVQYSLRHFGIDEPDLRKLCPFIGPPLADSFRERYGMSDAEAAEAVGRDAVPPAVRPGRKIRHREAFRESGSAPGRKRRALQRYAAGRGVWK